MITIYRYKNKNYNNIYELSEALGRDGIFIPLSIPEENLTPLGVTVEKQIEY